MKNVNLSYLGIIALILLASFSRIIPHAPNFTPIGAIALFGGFLLGIFLALFVNLFKEYPEPTTKTIR